MICWKISPSRKKKRARRRGIASVAAAGLIALSSQAQEPRVVTKQQPVDTANISFPNAPVGDVLSFYERLTGKRIIRDNNLANLNVTIYSNEAVEPEKAAAFVEAALLLNGVALVPSGDNTLKALSTKDKKPGSEVVPLFITPAGLPDSDQVVSYYMPFKFVSPEDGKKIFEAQVPLHDYGIITIAPGNTALLITESARVVQRLIELQRVIDIQPASIIKEFVQLQRADAERVAELVADALDDEGGSSGTGGGKGPAVVTPPSGNSATASAGDVAGSPGNGTLISGPVRLVPDTRTNRILVITKPQNFPTVRSLIEQFDEPVSLAKPEARVLRYVSATDVLPTLVEMLSDTPEGGVGGSSVAKGAAPRAMPVNGSSSGGMGGEGGAGRADQLAGPAENTVPQAMKIGKSLLVADPIANSILVSGPPETRAKVNMIIDELDRRPQQVYLAVIIGQLTLGEDFEFGIDYLLRVGQSGDSRVGGALLSTRQKFLGLTPEQIFTPQNISTALNGLTIYGVIGDALDYYVTALESTNRFKVLSRPIIYTANNKKAKIASGQKVPVPTSTLTELTDNTQNAAVQSSIDFKDVLLKLEVIPLINADGAVTLQIAQTNDSIVGNQEVSGNSIPIIGTQELNTTITVKDRQAVVLGGLVSESNRRDKSGLPFLNSLPGVGYLFGNLKKEKDRQELIIFIRPFVVDTDEEAKMVSEMEKNRTALPDDIKPLPKEKERMKKKAEPMEIRKAVPVAGPSPTGK
jgi:general secretion pathway protein D